MAAGPNAFAYLIILPAIVLRLTYSLVPLVQTVWMSFTNRSITNPGRFIGLANFVAQFIGSPSMNIVEGNLTEQGFVTSDGQVLPAPSATGSAAFYGIRPEHLVPNFDGIPMEVVVVEPMGSETQLVLKLGQTTLISLVRERLAVTPGSVMRFKPELQSVHLFDGESNRCAMN
jgi:ABC-type sugar transport system permease subunit